MKLINSKKLQTCSGRFQNDNFICHLLVAEINSVLKTIFSKKTDLSQIQIEKEKLKKFLESNQDEDESNEPTLSYQMTEEELDLEEERENLRKMLISSANHANDESSCQDTAHQDISFQATNDDTWTVPTDWSYSKPERVTSVRHLSTEDVQKNSEISEMWMPTTQLHFAGNSFPD